MGSNYHKLKKVYNFKQVIDFFYCKRQSDLIYFLEMKVFKF